MDTTVMPKQVIYFPNYTTEEEEKEYINVDSI
jgi:hypothetical protein